MLSILDYIKDILENENINDEDKLEQISELASPMPVAKKKISEAANPVAIHLAKILIYGFKEDWCDDIQKNLNSLTIGWKLKLKNNRYPTKEEFKEWIKIEINEPDDCIRIINNTIEDVKKEAKKRNIKYDEKIKDITPLEFFNSWNNFIDELSKIYIGNIRFEYDDIEKLIKSII